MLKPSEQDATMLQLEKELDGFQTTGATCVRFSPTGATLSAGGGNGGVKAWGTVESEWEPTGSADKAVRQFFFFAGASLYHDSQSVRVATYFIRVYVTGTMEWFPLLFIMQSVLQARMHSCCFSPSVILTYSGIQPGSPRMIPSSEAPAFFLRV